MNAVPAPAAAPDLAACYHCSLPVPDGSHWQVKIGGQPRAMCCPGCEAVAQTIVDQGLDDYYLNRTAYPANAGSAALVPPELRLYDSPQASACFDTGNGAAEATLAVDGIRCAACVWLIERHVARLPGVQEAHMNVATERLQVRWDNQRCKPGDILQALHGLGYAAYPYDAERRGAQMQVAARRLSRQLFVAGLGMMQVMMYAVPVYLAEAGSIEPGMIALMRWASLLLTLPVMAYSALPFFRGAWLSLKNRSLGMDVPVALGLGAAFIGSVDATWRGQGEVWFDSITMFVFLLLGSRYFELSARRKAAGALDRLQHALPASATRLTNYPDGRATEVVAASMLETGDYILVKPGEAIAADSVIIEGETAVDLAILTGESAPQHKPS